MKRDLIQIKNIFSRDHEGRSESSEDEVSGICTVPAVKEKEVKRSQITDFLALINSKSNKKL